MQNEFLQASVAEQQRDEALNHVQILTDKLEQVSGQNGQPAITPKDLRGLSIQTLKGLQVSPHFINTQLKKKKFNIFLLYSRPNCDLT